MTEITASTAAPPSAHREPSHLFLRVQEALFAATGEDLAERILRLRDGSPQVSYRKIAQDLVLITGIDITHEAPRRWYVRLVADNPVPVP
jgi:hypothetical protein